MNFTVTWKIEGEPEQFPSIDHALKNTFKDTGHIEIFERCFVIKALGNGHYETIQKDINNVCKHYPAHRIIVLMTPPNFRGAYAGRMGQAAAEQLQILAQQEYENTE